MTNEHIAARLREIASNLPNVADSEPICSALHEVANELEAQPAGDAGMPPRDPTKTNEQQGLFRKFIVRRTDGSDAPGGKHHGCDYFVLDVTHDRHAKAALAAYADAVEATHPLLSANMRTRWGLAAGDAGMPVVATEYVCKRPGRVSVYASVDDTGQEHRDEKWSTVEAYPLVRQRDAQAAIAARDARIAEHASDGEMLDWLVRKGTMHVGGSDARGWMVSDMRNGLVILSRGHATYRDAIRAAMKGTPS